MSRSSFLPIVLGLAALLACGGAQAAKVYRWKGSDGIVHYGDRAPDRGQQATARDLTVIPVRAEPAAVARLRLETRDDHTLAWADNLLAGPIEVMLEFGRGSNLVGTPALPARATVPANGSALVSVLSAADPRRAGGSELRLTTIPGNPNARPRDVDYRVPLQQRTQRVDQGYGGRFSHTDPQNLYAVDFAAEIGTPVLAARDGVVMQVESDFDKAGLSLEKYGGRANYVRILHDDGTMGLYAHLRPEGVLVHYTCARGGFGRSKIDVLTPRSIRIETQGIADDLPFNYVIQARRVGECSQRQSASAH